MNFDPEQPLRALHNLYCDLTGRTLTYQFYQREWCDFSKHFTADDLKTVLAWVERENKKREKKYHISTMLLKLVGDLATFDSFKADADLWKKEQMARNRAWRATTGESALAEMRREPDPQAPDRDAVVARDVLLKNLSELKSKLEKS